MNGRIKSGNRFIPDCPASKLAQACGTVLPTGLTQPEPVTTTRRRLMWQSGLLVRHRVIDGVLNGDFFSILIGNFDTELVFGVPSPVPRSQGVSPQIGHKRLLMGNLASSTPSVRQ